MISATELLVTVPVFAEPGKRCWSTLLPLILEHVGKILERDNVGDVLRARLACKHWHTCFTRCVARLTLYGAPVPLPAAANDYASASQPFPPPKPLATAQDWPHLELQAQAQLQQTQQLLQPDLSATPQEPLPHARMPPGLPRQHPSSPHPSARYGRHIQLIPSLAPTIKHVTVCGRACDLAGLRALAASLPSLTSLYLAASSYPAALPPQLQTQLQLTPQAAAPHEELNPVTTAAVAAAVDAKAAAAEAAPAGLDLLLVPRGGGGGGGGDGYWPPAPPRLEKLWVALHEDVPPYTLHQLLLLQGPSAVAVAPLRELGFLPPKAVGVDVSGVGASWVRPAFVRRMPYMDLSPLLDPRLAGVTRLVLPAMSNRREEQTPLPPAAAADARHRLPEQRQQQQQQEPPVQRQQQQRVQAPGHGQAGRTDGAYDSGSGPSPGPGALGFEDIVSRMTQLRSLTVLSQVELSSFYPSCLASLPGLRTLGLPGGVFCESASDLRLLTGLKLLTSLELNFLSEWWMDAGDLCVLSRLAQLRRLKFSLDYGLECADVMSEDEQYEHGMYDTGPNLDKLPTDLETGAAMEMEMIETDAGMEGQVLEQGRDVANVAVVAVYDRQQGRRQRHELAGNVAGEVSGGQRRRKYDTVDELARAMAAVLGRGVVQRGAARHVAYGASYSDPGAGDDWRAPLGCLTQLERLEMSLNNGGGRHLAEAVHAAAAWMTPSSPSTAAAATAAAAKEGECDGSGNGGGGGGVSLTLRDAPAAAFLDVPYWYKVATGSAAAADVTTAAAAVAPYCAGAFIAAASYGGAAGCVPLSPAPPRRVGFVGSPLVSLNLGAGRGARVSYGHILCLGLMTELRSLTLSFEVTPPPACTARPSPASGCSVAAEGRYDKADRTNQYDNPLLVLSRLRLLTELRIHIKQPQGSAYGIYEPSASDSGGAAFLVAAPMDDDVVQSCMENMPSLTSLALRGVGELGEGALAAVGRHGALRSLELRLKVFPPPTSSSNSPKPKWVTGAAGGGGGGGGAASSSMPGIGYGSYYALRAALARPGAAAAAATAAASGAVGIISLFDSSAVTPLGVSPQGPGSYAAGCGAQGYLPPLVQVDSGSSGAAAANDVAAAAAESVCRSVDWRERLLAAGVQGSEELLADVPYFVRPHHLPPTLTALDLTNAAFSAEWALCTQLAVPPPPAAATATAAAAPPPPPGTLLEPPRGSPSAAAAAATATATVATATATSVSKDPWMSDATKDVQFAHAGASISHSNSDFGNIDDPRVATTALQMPRLLSLKLTRRPPKLNRRQMLQRKGRREGALDPTRITDWHLVHLTACHPTLERLELYDIGDDGCGFGAAEAPDVKLHHRAVAQLGRLSYLESLTLRVGNRLRWRAQEALMTCLPVNLRRLHLYASHIYREALEMATRLVHLSSLQVVGYSEPSYVAELQAAGEVVSRQLPSCSLLLWPRDVDLLVDQHR